MSMRGMGCCESLTLVKKNLWKVSFVNDSFNDFRVEQLVAATVILHSNEYATGDKQIFLSHPFNYLIILNKNATNK